MTAAGGGLQTVRPPCKTARMTYAPEVEAPTPYDRAVTHIEQQVDRLNSALGLDDQPHGRRVTYGYIGDLTPGGTDSRRWYVFLPHPGRYGTAADRLGGHATDDVDGAKHTATLVAGATLIAEWNARR